MERLYAAIAGVICFGFCFGGYLILGDDAGPADMDGHARSGAAANTERVRLTGPQAPPSEAVMAAGNSASPRVAAPPARTPPARSRPESQPLHSASPSGKAPARRKPVRRPPEPPKVQPKPHASLRRTAVRVNFRDRGNKSTYVLPPREAARAWKAAQRLVHQAINVRSMQTLYSDRCSVRFGAPTPIGPTATKPASPRYYRFFIEHGAIRLVEQVRDGKPTVAWKVYYDDHGAPAVVVRPLGTDHTGSWLEYDQGGYLARCIRMALIDKQMMHGVDVYESRAGYSGVTKFEFTGTQPGQKQTLSGRVDYTPEGSFIHDLETGAKRKYRSRSFLELTTPADAKKHGLARLFPVPRP